MSSKSKKPSRKPGGNDAALTNRPFSDDLWRRAGQIADRYQFLVKHDPDEPYFYAFGVEARGAMSGGESITECEANIREAMTLWVATMLEQGKNPPPPAADEKRTAQLNVRLTEGEKSRIEEAARHAGYRGIADFVRAAALDKAS
mgnify:CR=1 FL=1